jgi:CHAT domain-containing protein
VLSLQNGEPLSKTSLRGLDGASRAIGSARPLVFLNACEVGRRVPALVGPGGFAEVFMELGASAVNAPLWSVSDTIAHQLAAVFYQTLKERPETPCAEILRRLRAKAYGESGGEDTYAAYCFYGDPLTVCSPGQA